MNKLGVDDLARSAISPDEAAMADITYTDNAREVCRDFAPVPALVIPYYNPDDTPLTYRRGRREAPFVRVRYLDRLPVKFKNGKRKPQRYAQPHSSGCHVYLPPVLDWREIMADPGYPLVITEGEKKALCGCLCGANVIGLGGVHNFLRNGFLLPELEAFTLENRDVLICFDSDAATNPNITMAETRLIAILGIQRGANVGIVRLHSDTPSKVGMDDYAADKGGEALLKLLSEKPFLDPLTRDVVALNEHVAWISAEGMLYEPASGLWMRKDKFVEGERYSAWETVFMHENKKTGEPVIEVVKTARKWLSHPAARRYSEALFRPGDTPVITSAVGAPALNLWTGWNTSPGSVRPFLDLNAFLFSNLPEDLRDFALKLLVYKAQHPMKKIPIATILVGEQGAGKTLWGQCMYDAFNPYSTIIGSAELGSSFHNFLERGVFAFINEASSFDIRRNRNLLLSLISDPVQRMNDKFRSVRDVHHYGQYVITANDKQIGSFDHDDRRMFVVGCPSKKVLGNEEAMLRFFRPIYEWKNENAGGEKLMNWMLRADLQGWAPPVAAPLTQEKVIAFREGLSSLQDMADEMREADDNVVFQWGAQAVAWASEAELSSDPAAVHMAHDVKDAWSKMTIRPWYTAEELALMFPALSASVSKNSSRRAQFTSPGDLSRQLRNCGIPYLRAADPHGFRWRGKFEQFLVIFDQDKWSGVMTQEQFEAHMRGWPRYADYKREKR